MLLVDDDPQMRRFLRATLTARGFRLVEAETLAAAEIAATSQAPDLVLLDLGLPDGDGIDLARREVSVEGRALYPTPIEWKLLLLLARNAGKVITHRQILREA